MKPGRSNRPWLVDILEAIARVHKALGATPLEEFQGDWRQQWLVQRGIEIISEASRRLSEDLKARHPEIPWKKVAAIGNILRHEYEDVAAPVIWKVARTDLPDLERVCREELLALEK